ncbi:MAG TPA: MMPL family transporter [Usitatibacter sp.]|nr:MMPL family transporter [Usitatibacter sp.]
MTARRAAIAVWLAGLALCALQLARTTFVADLSVFLPSAPTAAQRFLVDQLREGAFSRLMLVGIEGGDAATRARLSLAMQAALSRDPRFASVANGTGGFGQRVEALVFEHRYVLSPAVTPARFSVDGLRAAIGESIERIASPAGLALKDLLARDPTGETLAVIDAFGNEEGPRRTEGVWSSADGARAILLAKPRAPASDLDGQAEAMGAIRGAFAAASPSLPPEARPRLLLTGPGVFAVQSRAMIVHDVGRLAAASAIAVAVLLLIAYRSPLALFLGLVPVVSGALTGIGAVSLGFGSVHGVTLGFGTTLIGEAVDYAIYYFVQSGEAPHDWRARSWPTVRLGVLTSIAGFAALLFTGLPGLAQLAVYSIAGLAAAAAVTRFILPSLVPARLVLRDLSPWGTTLGHVATRLGRARWALAIVAAVCASVLFSHRTTLWNTDIASLNPVPAEDRRLDAQLRDALGASDARLVIAASAPDAQAALQAAERIGTRLDGEVAAGRLGAYESPARFLPSEATQRRRLASLPPAAELRARLAEALRGSALPAGRLEPFVQDIEKARTGPLLTAAEVGATALGSALDGTLMRTASGWTVVMGLHPPHGRALDSRALAAAVEAAGVRDAMLVDVKAEVDRLYAGYFGRALVASALGIIAIVALLAIALRSIPALARVMASLAAAVLLTAAWYAATGTALTLLHLVGLLLVVAIGSNYALFFERLRETRAGSPRTLASLALANATAVASFGILAVSAIPVLHAIGLTVAVGTAAALVFAAMLSS